MHGSSVMQTCPAAERVGNYHTAMRAPRLDLEQAHTLIPGADEEQPIHSPQAARHPQLNLYGSARPCARLRKRNSMTTISRAPTFGPHFTPASFSPSPDAWAHKLHPSPLQDAGKAALSAADAQPAPELPAGAHSSHTPEAASVGPVHAGATKARARPVWKIFRYSQI